MENLEKIVSDALKWAINDHGPTTLANRASAAKRITVRIRDAAKRERDHLLTTTPRKSRHGALERRQDQS
jgi:hypothetical protein